MAILKKLIICVVALSLALSVMVLPTMAEQEDGHDHAEAFSPRYSNAPCLYCGGRMVYYGTTSYKGIRYIITRCIDCGEYRHSEY